MPLEAASFYPLGESSGQTLHTLWTVPGKEGVGVRAAMVTFPRYVRMPSESPDLSPNRFLPESRQCLGVMER